MEKNREGRFDYLFDESRPSLDVALAKQAILDLLNSYGGQGGTGRHTSARDDVARVESNYQGKTPDQIE